MYKPVDEEPNRISIFFIDIRSSYFYSAILGEKN